MCWCWSVLAHVRAVTFLFNHNILKVSKLAGRGKKNLISDQSIQKSWQNVTSKLNKKKLQSWCRNLLIFIKNMHHKIKNDKEKKCFFLFYFPSFLCLLFCIIMAAFSQCSPPSVGMWYLSIAEWKKGGGRKWCSLIPESLTSNHANLVHFEANPAPTICRVKTTIYYACIAPSLW